eukprot:NODE_68_length_25399_cov_0.885771.p6 type:complete len:425 gc:universal NODE_68_length_25399_cov_0.885771:18745-20019(+)
MQKSAKMYWSAIKSQHVPIRPQYFTKLPLQMTRQSFSLWAFWGSIVVGNLALNYVLFQSFIALLIQFVPVGFLIGVTFFYSFSYYYTPSHYKEKKLVPMNQYYHDYIRQVINLPKDIWPLLKNRHQHVRFAFAVEDFKFFLGTWLPELLWHSKSQDKDQVTDHYDRGNDFYNAFLGDMMIYTSGMVTPQLLKGVPEKDLGDIEGMLNALDCPFGLNALESIQLAKLKHVCQTLELEPGMNMLDIGCGWGTLANYASKRYDVNSLGVTLAKNQVQFGSYVAKQLNQSEKVKLLACDYRDIPNTKYDRISCLEMAEHVGVKRFGAFMDQLYNILNDDGVLFIQVAGLRRAWQLEDLIWGFFMARYIFPGADASTPLNWYISQLEYAGFEIQSTKTIGTHYGATLKAWYDNWLEKEDQIRQRLFLFI